MTAAAVPTAETSQTFRRTIDVTGDPRTGRIESCRIRVADGECASKRELAPNIKGEFADDGSLLAILLLGSIQPNESRAALLRTSVAEPLMRYILGATPVEFAG